MPVVIQTKFPCMFGYDRAISKTHCRPNTELTVHNTDGISHMTTSCICLSW